jgi:hypothetical protein
MDTDTTRWATFSLPGGSIRSDLPVILRAMSDMNALISQAAKSRRSRRGGLLDAVKNTDLTDGRQQRLSAAEIRYETAIKRGDEVGIEMASAAIDKVLDEGRQARKEAEAAAVPSFDGGVQKRIHKPAHVEMAERANEGSAALMRRAFEASADRPSRGSFL